MLKYRNQGMDMEVQKTKYGGEKKGRLSVFSALLTHDCAL